MCSRELLESPHILFYFMYVFRHCFHHPHDHHSPSRHVTFIHSPRRRIIFSAKHRQRGAPPLSARVSRRKRRSTGEPTNHCGDELRTRWPDSKRATHTRSPLLLFYFSTNAGSCRCRWSIVDGPRHCDDPGQCSIVIISLPDNPYRLYLHLVVQVKKSWFYVSFIK